MRKTAPGTLRAAAPLAAVLAAGLFAGPSSALHPAAPVPPAPGRPITPVILDPGHGGDDLGAVVAGRREKDIVLAVARKLQSRLARAAGIPAALTRENDAYVTLDERMVDGVDRSGSIFVSLHVNEVKEKKASGAVVYSYGPDAPRSRRKRRHPGVPPMPAPPRGQSADSERLARTFARTLRADGFRAEPAKSDYYVLKNPALPSVLIELGYLSNPEEAAKLSEPAYQDRIAESLAKAIEEYAAGRRSLRAEIAAAPKAVSKL